MRIEKSPFSHLRKLEQGLKNKPEQVFELLLLSQRKTSKKGLTKLWTKDNTTKTKQEQENKKYSLAVWTTMTVTRLFRNHKQ
jgi:hypothetical protein